MFVQINLYRQNNRAAKLLPEAEARAHFNLILEGMRLLSDWSGKVLRQSAWKYAHPNTEKLGPEAQKKYARVVKHNYTDEERLVLVEVIACVKGLAAVMLRHDSLLSPIIRANIHADLQDFVQVHLREMICFASKKKKAVREEMLQLRTLAADWKVRGSLIVFIFVHVSFPIFVSIRWSFHYNLCREGRSPTTRPSSARK